MQIARKGDKMAKEKQIELTESEIRAINAVLSRDQRVELIPTREGVKVYHVRREEVKKGATGASR